MKKKRILTFSRDSDYCHMYLRQSVSYLLLHGQIKTYKKWSNQIVRKTDRVVTIAKKQNLAATRQLQKFLINHPYKPHVSLIHYTMYDIATRYKDRPSGFCTRTVIGRRKGDNSQIILLKLI